jgi:hypothetical protein
MLVLWSSRNHTPIKYKCLIKGGGRKQIIHKYFSRTYDSKTTWFQTARVWRPLFESSRYHSYPRWKHSQIYYSIQCTSFQVKMDLRIDIRSHDLDYIGPFGTNSQQTYGGFISLLYLLYLGNKCGDPTRKGGCLALAIPNNHTKCCFMSQS